ncbi:MAG: radical SAM protein [Bacteroidales bacterium]
MPSNNDEKKHINIPIFIPELACPFQCIFCNQRKISGQLHVPDEKEIINIIESYLKTIVLENSDVQFAYFGGNFTGLSIKEQENFLKLVDPYIKIGKISGIRISTRPDYINEEILTLLKKHHVKSIELGAQSMDDEVLKKSKRGHTSTQTEKAIALVKDFGFSLGLQMMVGLPGDTLESTIYTANKIVELGAENTRIYPTLVIKGTHLENLYKQGKYQSLSLDAAVNWSREAVIIFDKAGIKILKLGLHPSEGLINGNDLIAGPFHPSFHELVLTSRWREIFEIISEKGNTVEITVAPDQINAAIGYQGSNKKYLLQRYKSVKFESDNTKSGREHRIEVKQI